MCSWNFVSSDASLCLFLCPWNPIALPASMDVGQPVLQSETLSQNQAKPNPTRTTKRVLLCTGIVLSKDPGTSITMANPSQTSLGTDAASASLSTLQSLSFPSLQKVLPEQPRGIRAVGASESWSLSPYPVDLICCISLLQRPAPSHSCHCWG